MWGVTISIGDVALTFLYIYFPIIVIVLIFGVKTREAILKHSKAGHSSSIYGMY